MTTPAPQLQASWRAYAAVSLAVGVLLLILLFVSAGASVLA